MSDPEKYTVGWICAIDTEAVAAVAFLDEEHEPARHIGRDDNNSYELGRMGDHNVVIAVLPDGEYGTNSAAAVARDMARSFPNIRIGLMVGIGGGAPSPEHDIRLGDVVVSRPEGGMGGVIQYDFGKTIQDQTFRQTGFLNQPPALLRTAASALRRRYKGKGHNLIDEANKALSKIKKKKQFTRPPGTNDRLYKSDVVHPAGGGSLSDQCERSCGLVDGHLIVRVDRDEEDDDPAIHYGLIASGNQLMKDARIRDQLASEKNILCFEMEAAGLMNHFPCMVIRGICDYSDSHKNKDWQGFAALMAAAYAKDLLRQIHPTSLETQVRIEELLTEVEQKVNAVQITSESIKSNLHAARMKEWLSPPDPSTNANMARKVRHEGSGSWLLQSSVLHSWHAGSLRHLWLRGFAGCGKTVLSAAILDHLAAQNSRSSGNIVLGFFFDFSDRGKQTVDGMLRSFAFQLYSEGHERSREYLEWLFKEQSNGLTQPSSAALHDCVRIMLAAQDGKVFIVLDALDEATERQALLAWITETYYAQELHNVQLVYTGRPEPEFLNSLTQTIGEEACLALDKQKVNADIRSYVGAKLDDEPFAHQNLSEDLRKQIQCKIGDGADGMFRWATCQLDALARCMTPHATRQTLDDLPKDLHQTYTQMMRRIPDDLRRDAMRLLQFLVHALLPITVAEAIEVIATEAETETPNFNPERRLHHQNDILQYCPGMISIVDDSDRSIKRRKLHLAHFSVKEYLLTQDQFSIMSGSLCVARTCLTYLSHLSHEEWDFSTCDGLLDPKFPLEDYAEKHWMVHASSAPGSEQFIREATSYLNEGQYIRNKLGKSQDSLIYACIHGCFAIAQRLLHEGANVNTWSQVHHDYPRHRARPMPAVRYGSHSGNYGTALQAASTKGHLEIVRLLLDQGANVNAQGGYYGTALQAASHGDTEGHLQIVRLLWEKGADINAQCGSYGTALQAAAHRATKIHKEILQFLMDKGANVNALCGAYGNALSAACSGGSKDHEEVVRLLLDRGADINAYTSRHRTALDYASQGGSETIVRLLLDRGAEVNTPPGRMRKTALYKAASERNLSIARLLIDRGANLDTPSGVYGHTALHAACRRGHEELVRLLLHGGADMEIQAGSDGKPLHAASSEGNLEITRLLLDNGASINALGGIHRTALQGAAVGGHLEVVQLLLDYGANINPQGREHGHDTRGVE